MIDANLMTAIRTSAVVRDKATLPRFKPFFGRGPLHPAGVRAAWRRCEPRRHCEFTSAMGLGHLFTLSRATQVMEMLFGRVASGVARFRIEALQERYFRVLRMRNDGEGRATQVCLTND
jgi:hypothetical protein